MKKVLSLKDVKILNKKELKYLLGGARCGWGDSECCGTAAWQCGTGAESGGLWDASKTICHCV